jgi:hypothetical protein
VTRPARSIRLFSRIGESGHALHDAKVGERRRVSERSQTVRTLCVSCAARRSLKHGRGTAETTWPDFAERTVRTAWPAGSASDPPGACTRAVARTTSSRALHLCNSFRGLNEWPRESARSGFHPVRCNSTGDRFAGAFLMPVEALWREIGQHRTMITLGELLRLEELFGANFQSRSCGPFTGPHPACPPSGEALLRVF